MLVLLLISLPLIIVRCRVIQSNKLTESDEGSNWIDVGDGLHRRRRENIGTEYAVQLWYSFL